jgi:hypothetical protein
MTFLMPDEGELWFLDQVAANNLLDGYVLRLYQNNYTPVEASVLANFTEATFSGYASNASVNFGSASEVANKAQVTDAAARVFTHNGGATANTVYGYYYATALKVILAERFAAPVSMATAGDNISIQMTLKLNGV